MTEKHTICSMHRFHDKTAIYLGSGQTIYLTAKDTRLIAHQLYKCAKDVATYNFGESRFKSFLLEGK